MNNLPLKNISIFNFVRAKCMLNGKCTAFKTATCGNTNNKIQLHSMVHV